MRQLKISKNITNRETPSMEMYLREISRYDLITPEQEYDLAKKVRMGDQDALEKLVRANLRFVVSIAKKYQFMGLALPDLINEGNVGLVKAAERFDESKGFKFISYAVWWIRQSILLALAEYSRMIRLPLNKIDSVRKVHRAFEKLEQEYEREPFPEEMAELLHLKEADVADTMRISMTHVSMDAPFSNEEENSLVDVLTNPNAEEADREVSYRQSLQKDIDLALSTLPERQKEVVKLSFGIGSLQPMSLDDIADRFKMTVVRVRQIKEQAIQMLKSTRRSNQLRTYLG